MDEITETYVMSSETTKDIILAIIHGDKFKGNQLVFEFLDLLNNYTTALEVAKKQRAGKYFFGEATQ